MIPPHSSDPATHDDNWAAPVEHEGAASNGLLFRTKVLDRGEKPGSKPKIEFILENTTSKVLVIDLHAAHVRLSRMAPSGFLREERTGEPIGPCWGVTKNRLRKIPPGEERSYTIPFSLSSFLLYGPRVRYGVEIGGTRYYHYQPVRPGEYCVSFSYASAGAAKDRTKPSLMPGEQLWGGEARSAPQVIHLPSKRDIRRDLSLGRWHRVNPKKPYSIMPRVVGFLRRRVRREQWSTLSAS